MYNLNIISYQNGSKKVENFLESGVKTKEQIEEIGQMFQSLLIHAPNHKSLVIEVSKLSFSYGDRFECDTINFDGKYIYKESLPEDFLTKEDNIEESKVIARIVELASVLYGTVHDKAFTVEVTKSSVDVIFM